MPCNSEPAIRIREHSKSSRSSDDRHALGRAVSTMPAEAACGPARPGPTAGPATPGGSIKTCDREIRLRPRKLPLDNCRQLPTWKIVSRHSTMPRPRRDSIAAVTLDAQSHYLNPIAADRTAVLTHQPDRRACLHRSVWLWAAFDVAIRPLRAARCRNRVAAPRTGGGIMLEMSREIFPLRRAKFSPVHSQRAELTLG